MSGRRLAGRSSLGLRWSHHNFKLSFSGFKSQEFFLQSGDFFCDLAKLIRVLACAEAGSPELFLDVFLKLASQDPEIEVPPDRQVLSRLHLQTEKREDPRRGIQGRGNLHHR